MVDQLYRAGDRYPGGTSGAIRVERLLGNATRNHLGKAEERIRNLQRVIREQPLDASDRAAAQRMIDDLTSVWMDIDAIERHPSPAVRAFWPTCFPGEPVLPRR